MSSEQKIVLVLTVVSATSVVAFVGMAIYCYSRKMKKLRSQMNYPTVEKLPATFEPVVPLTRQRSLHSRLVSNFTQVSGVNMPLDEKWEIDRGIISLQEVLGEGAFGRVMKAEVLGMPNMPCRLNVAVKILKGGF